MELSSISSSSCNPSPLSSSPFSVQEELNSYPRRASDDAGAPSFCSIKKTGSFDDIVRRSSNENPAPPPPSLEGRAVIVKQKPKKTLKFSSTVKFHAAPFPEEAFIQSDEKENKTKDIDISVGKLGLTHKDSYYKSLHKANKNLFDQAFRKKDLSIRRQSLASLANPSNSSPPPLSKSHSVKSMKSSPITSLEKSQSLALKKSPSSTIDKLTSPEIETKSKTLLSTVEKLRSSFRKNKKLQSEKTSTETIKVISPLLQHLDGQKNIKSCKDQEPILFTSFQERLEKILKTRNTNEIPALVEDLIDQEPKTWENLFKHIFKQLKQPLSTVTIRDRYFLVEVLSQTIKNMESYQILSQRKILEKKCKSSTAFESLNRKIQEAYAHELIAILLTEAESPTITGKSINPVRKNSDLSIPILTHSSTIKKLDNHDKVIFSHLWFIPTELFIETLLQKFLDNRDLASKILPAICKLIEFKQFYSISPKLIYHLYEKSKKESIRDTDEKETKKSIKDFKATMWHCIRQNFKVMNKSLGSSSHFTSKKEQKTQLLSFTKVLGKAIENNRINEGMLTHLALDLKQLEAQFLSQIQPSTIISYQRDNKSKEALALTTYIEHTNILHYWTMSTILSSPDEVIRTRWLDFFIKLTQHCVESGNFNSAFTLLSAWSHPCISRLKSNNELKKQTLETKEGLENFFSTSWNYKEYRAKIEKLNEDKDNKKMDHKNFVIPIFALYFSDLTGIENNNTFKEDGHLNSAKIAMLNEQHKTLQYYQKDLLNCESEFKCTYDLAQCLIEERKRIKNKFLDLIDFSELYDLSYGWEMYVGLVKIEPAKIESVINSHEGVWASTCAAVLDETTKTYQLNAYVELNPSSASEELAKGKELAREIYNLLHTKIDEKEIPHEIHFVLNPTEKINRSKLDTLSVLLSVKRSELKLSMTNLKNNLILGV